MKGTGLKVFALISTAALIAATIDLNNLDNYSDEPVPGYILRDNTPDENQITDQGATLGRILFYDKKLSANNAVACASCHHQQFAFGDTALVSLGHLGGVTGRHAMRLVNARYSEESKFFWNERASSLEDQTTRPIQDAVEMGFSGQNGQPGLDSLIRKMEGITYYPGLFALVYGDPGITETRIQQALAQFVRSIQSFDSRFDAGRAIAPNDGAPFPNFTPQENQGKTIFLAPPAQGGAGCQGCHRAPEFDIDPLSLNNGIIGVAGDPDAIDLTNTKAPSLRDLFNPNGQLNGPLMHDGSLKTIREVIDHYNQITVDPANTNLDPKLRGIPPGAPGPGPGQQLNLTDAQKNALAAFLRTLTGNDIYTNPKWSDPFDENGDLDLVGLTTATVHHEILRSVIFPNPLRSTFNLEIEPGNYDLSIFNSRGQLVHSARIEGNTSIDADAWPPGMLIVQIADRRSGAKTVEKILKVQ